MKPLIFIYADESCLGNGKADTGRPGGAAALVEFFHPERGWIRRDVWTSHPDTTNNRMAITSALISLGGLKHPSRVVFTSDSRYLVDGAGSWVAGWIRKGWVKSDKSPVENQELWKALLPVAARHEIQWRWVKGHNSHCQNELANDLAIEAATNQTSSDGFVESRFHEWLKKAEQRRGARAIRYVPEDLATFRFQPSPSMQASSVQGGRGR